MTHPNPLLVSLTAAAQEAGGTDVFAQDVYAHLERTEPAARVMFPFGMTQQRDRFVAVFTRMIANAHDPETDTVRLADHEITRVRRLAVDHLKYGTRTEHYPAVGNSLLFALGMHLSEVGLWDQKTFDLWAGTYGAVAKVMTDAADAWLAAGNPRWVDAVVARRFSPDDDGPVTLLLHGLMHHTGNGPDRPGGYPVPTGQRISACWWARPGGWAPVTVADTSGRRLAVTVARAANNPAVHALTEDTQPGDLVRLEPPNPIDPAVEDTPS